MMKKKEEVDSGGGESSSPDEEAVPTTNDDDPEEEKYLVSSSSSAIEQDDKTTTNTPQEEEVTAANDDHNNKHEEWRIILYYCYVPINDQIENHVHFHQQLCQELNLMGRIRVSHEGINGVLSGRLEQCHQYEDLLRRELLRLIPPPPTTTAVTPQQLAEADADAKGEEEKEAKKESDSRDDCSSCCWELDVKYCQLRNDLPVSTQLFDSLMVKATNCVVSLFEPGLLHPADGNGDNNSSNNNSKKKHHHSKQANRRKRRQQQRREQQQQKLMMGENNNNNGSNNILQEMANQISNFPGGQHLSPQEWNDKLLSSKGDAVLLDCRNVYESNVGYFQVSSTNNNNNHNNNKTIETLLTNTRKYSDLPKVLVQSKDQWINKKQIFMYCTGGVRCEQASKFVQAMVATERQQHQGKEEEEQQQEETDVVEVYQLHGGIQRYLEQFHSNNNTQQQQIDTTKKEQAAQEKKGETTPPQGEQDETTTTTTTIEKTNQQQRQQQDPPSPCLYRGLNFVFDPRRTDPMLSSSTTDTTKCVVGKCCLCGIPHDDYDNGHSPADNQEARCCKCRILLLVCPSCRLKVQSWGEDPKDDPLPPLFCGIDACTDYQATGANPVTTAVPIV